MSKSTPPRPSMSKARRLRLFTEQGGICWICKKKVKAGEEYDLDHIIPWALSFDDTDENLRVAHKTCHRGEKSKTSDDVKRISKAKRQGSIDGRGQWARRQKNGPQIKSGPSNWPKGVNIQSRGWEKKK